jgi:hypothetical protein
MQQNGRVVVNVGYVKPYKGLHEINCIMQQQLKGPQKVYSFSVHGINNYIFLKMKCILLCVYL